MELDVKLTVEERQALSYLVQGDEELSCDHPEHAEDWEAHRGDAQWYIQVHCTHCNYKSLVHAYCTGFRDWLHAKGHYVACNNCEQLTDGWTAVILCKRMDGNW